MFLVCIRKQFHFSWPSCGDWRRDIQFWNTQLTDYLFLGGPLKLSPSLLPAFTSRCRVHCWRNIHCFQTSMQNSFVIQISESIFKKKTSCLSQVHVHKMAVVLCQILFLLVGLCREHNKQLVVFDPPIFWSNFVMAVQVGETLHLCIHFIVW